MHIFFLFSYFIKFVYNSQLLFDSTIYDCFKILEKIIYIKFNCEWEIVLNTNPVYVILYKLMLSLIFYCYLK